MENSEKSDMIRLAEQNVLNRVREAQDWIKIMRAINYAGMSFFPPRMQDTCAESWYRGMRMAEDALYHKLCEYQAEAMLFVGVGGEETEKFAREKFRERFGLDEDGNKHYEIMSLLNQYLDVPGMHLVDDELEFRKQAKDAYEATDEDTFVDNPMS